MKKIFFIITLTLFAFNSQAQGTLQFNQIINIIKTESVTAITSPTVHYSPTTDTIVPVGKVWMVKKVEASCYDADGISSSIICPKFFLNDEQIINNINDLEMLEGSWLKSGTKLSFYAYSCANHSWTNYNLTFYLSIIEYNIIP